MTERFDQDGALHHPIDETGLFNPEDLLRYQEQLRQQKLNEYMQWSLDDLEQEKDALKTKLSLYSDSEASRHLAVVRTAIGMKHHLETEKAHNEQARQAAIIKARRDLEVLEGTAIAPVATPIETATEASVVSPHMDDEAVPVETSFIPDVVNGVSLAELTQQQRQQWLQQYEDEAAQEQEEAVEEQAAPVEEAASPLTATVELSDTPVEATPDEPAAPQNQAQPLLIPGGHPALNMQTSKAADALSTVKGAALNLRPRTRKSKFIAGGALILAAAGGVTWAQTGGENAAQVDKLIPECTDETSIEAAMATVPFDAASTVEWSLTENAEAPPIRIGSEGKNLPLLTVKGATVELEVCAVDGGVDLTSAETVTVDAADLMTRAIVRGADGRSSWQRPEDSAFLGAVDAGYLTNEEAAGYMLSMKSTEFVHQATDVAIHNLAVNIENGDAMIDEKTSAKDALVAAALDGLKQQMTAADKELVIEGDTGESALDFVTADESVETTLRFDDMKTQVAVGTMELTKLHADDKKKDEKEAKDK